MSHTHTHTHISLLISFSLLFHTHIYRHAHTLFLFIAVNLDFKLAHCTDASYHILQCFMDSSSLVLDYLQISCTHRFLFILFFFQQNKIF